MKNVVATEQYRERQARARAAILGDWACWHVKRALADEHPGAGWWIEMAVSDAVRAAHAARVALKETR